MCTQICRGDEVRSNFRAGNDKALRETTHNFAKLNFDATIELKHDISNLKEEVRSLKITVRELVDEVKSGFKDLKRLFLGGHSSSNATTSQELLDAEPTEVDEEADTPPAGGRVFPIFHKGSRKDGMSTKDFVIQVADSTPASDLLKTFVMNRLTISSDLHWDVSVAEEVKRSARFAIQAMRELATGDEIKLIDGLRPETSSSTYTTWLFDLESTAKSMADIVHSNLWLEETRRLTPEEFKTRRQNALKKTIGSWYKRLSALPSVKKHATCSGGFIIDSFSPASPQTTDVANSKVGEGEDNPTKVQRIDSFYKSHSQTST